MARRSERDAEFSAFMDAARQSLGRTAWFLTGDRDAAAELLQATLVKTYVAWPRVRPDGALAYARRIMINTDLDRHRAQRFSVPVADPPEVGVVEDATAAVDEQHRLGALLAALPAHQRRVVVLRYLHDLSEADVAAELDLPLGTVKSNASRGLAALRTALVGTTEGNQR